MSEPNGRGTSSVETVEIVAPDGVVSLADMWRPDGEPIGAVVMLHGGSWIRGTRDSYREWGPHLAGLGLLALSLDYRLATADVPSWPAVMDDVDAAVGFCADRIPAGAPVGLMGDSAGAHLAADYALKPAGRSPIGFAVLLYGIFEVAEYHSACLDRPGDNPSRNLMGVGPDSDVAAYAAASPLRVLEAATPGTVESVPLLLAWGDSDPVVDAGQSDRFVAELSRHGVGHDAHRFSGHGHYWFNRTPNRDGGGLDEAPNDLFVPIVDRFIARECGHSEGAPT